MKRIILIIGILSSFCLYATEEGPVVRTVSDHGPQGLVVNYQINDFQQFAQSRGGHDFHRIFLNGFSHLMEEGYPALPSNRDIILIPDGAQSDLSVEIIRADTIEGITVWPAQPPHPDGYSIEGRANSTESSQYFAYDTLFYGSNQYYPKKIVHIDTSQYLRHNPVGIVHVTPFQYNPKKKKLVIIREVRYSLDFSGADSFFHNIKRHSAGYLKTLPHKFINHESIRQEMDAYLSSVERSIPHVDYLIVAHNMFSMAADSLAQWKRQLGHGVHVMKRSHWTTGQVMDSVHSFYHNASVHPDFLLIIGDQEHVPAQLVHIDRNRYSDNYYVCMGPSGDFFPDMARGRISAKSNQEAMTIINKIINYEKNPPQDPGFYNSALVAAYFQDDDTTGYASRRFIHTSEEVKDYLESMNYQVDRVYYTDSYINPTNYNLGHYSDGQPLPPELLRSNGFAWDGDADDIVEIFDKGVFLALHRDHGSTDGWVDPPFFSPDVARLDNQNRLPVVFSINCSSGRFIDDKTFAENFLRKNPGGAVGVMASSAVSFSGTNDALSIGFFDAIWPNPGLIPDFGPGGVSNPSPSPLNESIRQMGYVLNHGLLRMTETWSVSRSTHELFHYHGDPAMRIWVQQPQPVTAYHDMSLTCGDTSLSISSANLADATATLVMNNQKMDRITLQQGAGIMVFPPVSNVKPYALLTISGQDMAPYVVKIPVTGCSNPPQAKFVASDSILSCFSNTIELFDNSQFHPQQWEWIIQPSSWTIEGGSQTSDYMKVSFLDTGYYHVGIKVTNSYGVDSLVKHQKVFVAPAKQAPYFQTFEQLGSFGLSDTTWQARSSSTFEWFIYNDSTPSFRTGPIVDHTTGTSQGKYIYTEASSGKPGDTALLISPALDISTLNTPAIKFWYHMFGATINELHIDVNDGTGWQQLRSFYGQQHTSYTDPWKMALVDLSHINSSCIQIRFRAIRGASWTGDIAVDDIEILDYDSLPHFLFTTSKENTCCGFTVQFHDLSCCGVTQRTWHFPGGNPATSTQKNPVVTYDVAGVYDVTLTLANAQGTDTHTKQGMVHVRENQSLPLFEDFETFVAGSPGVFQNDWAMEKTHDFDWRVGSGTTPSSGTGPAVDHTTGSSNGIYVFTEPSHVSESEEAYLITPCLELPSNEKAFMSFWIHMYGSGIDTIHIDVHDGTHWHKNVFKVGGERQTSHTDSWEQVVADISAFEGKNVMIRFRSARTRSWRDDKAVDDVFFFSGGMVMHPDTLDFGQVELGNTNSKDIVVYNTSPENLWIDDLSLPVGFQAGAYQGMQIAPGDSQSIAITFNPNTLDFFSGYVSVHTSLNDDSVFVKGKTPGAGGRKARYNESIDVFPNPASGNIFIRIEQTKEANAFNGAIINVNGQVVKQWVEEKIPPSGLIEKNIEHLARGVYHIRITTQHNTFSGAFIKY